MTARHLIVLAVGVIAISWAAPLIRLAEPAPALAIAALRLVLAAPPMVAVALVRRDGGLGRLSARDWSLLVLSAVALAAHFAAV